MIYLAYFLFLFAIIQLIVAFVNLMYMNQIKSEICEFNDLISIGIPARNEEKNIGKLLRDLQKQHYQNFEIIVFNDLSIDKTAEIVNQFAKDDKRITVINSESLPQGWLGKNYACYSISKQAKGKYLLFLDADVRVKDDNIKQSLALAERHKLGLLSIFPKQKMLSFGERLTVPNMNFILLSLLPLVLVHKSKYSSLAAANGQFMLCNATDYFETNPHEKFKSNKVEDIAIAQYYKERNIAIMCLLGDSSIECRMYNGFTEAVNGFSKNVISFFGNSALVAILFWLITTFGFIILFISLKPAFLMLYIGLVICTRVFVLIASRQSVLLHLLLLIPQQLTLGFIIFTSLLYKHKKQYKWKDRNI